MAFSLISNAQVAKCRNAIVVLSSAGNGSITAAGINNGSTGYVSLSLTPTTFNCSNVGTNVVTLTATAANGNASTCTGTATVRDLTKPVARCKSATVIIQGDTTLGYELIDNGSTDACGIAEYTLTPNFFTCQNGSTPVVLAVKDANGNISNCMALVTIICSN